MSWCAALGNLSFLGSCWQQDTRINGDKNDRSQTTTTFSCFSGGCCCNTVEPTEETLKKIHEAAKRKIIDVTNSCVSSWDEGDSKNRIQEAVETLGTNTSVEIIAIAKKMSGYTGPKTSSRKQLQTYLSVLSDFMYIPQNYNLPQHYGLSEEQTDIVRQTLFMLFQLFGPGHQVEMNETSLTFTVPNKLLKEANSEFQEKKTQHIDHDKTKTVTFLSDRTFAGVLMQKKTQIQKASKISDLESKIIESMIQIAKTNAYNKRASFQAARRSIGLKFQRDVVNNQPSQATI